MNKSRGFTLIELLVVIAIIGILAGIVLASLGAARSKGGDAAVQSNLSTIRRQAEIFANNNSYVYGTTGAASTTCVAGTANTLFADPVIMAAMNGARTSGGGSIACSYNQTSNTWVIAATLKSDSTKAWCVSSNGSSTQITWNSALTAPNSCL